MRAQLEAFLDQDGKSSLTSPSRTDKYDRSEADTTPPTDRNAAVAARRKLGRCVRSGRHCSRSYKDTLRKRPACAPQPHNAEERFASQTGGPHWPATS